MMNLLKAGAVIIVCVAVIIAAQWVVGKAKPRMRPRPDGEAVVKVRKAQERDFADRIEAVGTAKSNESVTITAAVSEQVKSVLFEAGVVVRSGDLLVELEAEEEKAQAAEARVDREEQKRELDRIRRLVEKQVQTGQQFDQQKSKYEEAVARLQAAEARLRDRRIFAPFSGILGFRMISPGALVQPGTAITTLDDINPIKLDFTVPELFISSLKKGQRIEAQSAAWPGRSFSGRVDVINTRVNQTTRAVQIQAIIPNSDGVLRPGMLLNVDLIANPRKSLAAPEKSLVAYGGRQFVYVARKDDTVEKREIRIGRRDVGEVEILSGLREGELVVTEGVMGLRDGAKARIVEKSDNDGTVLKAQGTSR